MHKWTIRCTYGPGAVSKRKAALAAHEAYLVAHSREIRFAGPMFGADGETRTGLWLLIDAPDRAAAERFIAGEGFNRAGMFGEIEIKRFVGRSPEERRQIGIVADGALQMFICECIASPDAADVGKATGEGRDQHQETMVGRVVVRGSSVSDDGSADLGTIAIIEVENRAAAEAFVAADPLLRAGGSRRMRIDRWRFGKSVA